MRLEIGSNSIVFKNRNEKSIFLTYNIIKLIFIL